MRFAATPARKAVFPLSARRTPEFRRAERGSFQGICSTVERRGECPVSALSVRFGERCGARIRKPVRDGFSPDLPIRSEESGRHRIRSSENVPESSHAAMGGSDTGNPESAAVSSGAVPGWRCRIPRSEVFGILSKRERRAPGKLLVHCGGAVSAETGNALSPSVPVRNRAFRRKVRAENGFSTGENSIREGILFLKLVKFEKIFEFEYHVPLK